MKNSEQWMSLKGQENGAEYICQTKLSLREECGICLAVICLPEVCRTWTYQVRAIIYFLSLFTLVLLQNR